MFREGRPGMKQKADIRKAETSDAKMLSEFDGTVFSDPWSEKSFLDSISNESYIITIIEYEGKFAGYAAWSYIFDEANLDKIAVSELFRRKGLGEFLLSESEKMLPECVGIFNLEVRESNCGAVHLYDKCGYEIVGRRKRFYRDPDEDALLMTKRKG